MAKRRMMVQIIPRVILTLPSTISMEIKKGRKRRNRRHQVATAILVKQEHWGTFPFADGKLEFLLKTGFPCLPRCSAGTVQYPVIRLVLLQYNTESKTDTDVPKDQE